MGNLESPLVDDGVSATAREKCTCGELPVGLRFSRVVGLHLVSLANNHLMDLGKEGFSSTMAALDGAGIKHIGAGRNIEEASASYSARSPAKKVAFLARSSVEVSSPCYATADGPGVAFLEESELLASIRECSRESDLTVVILHWGMEHDPLPIASTACAGSEDRLGRGRCPARPPPSCPTGGGVSGRGPGVVQQRQLSFRRVRMGHAAGRWGVRRSLLELTGANREGMVLQVRVGSEGGLSARPMFTRVSRNATLELDGNRARERQYQRICAHLKLPLTLSSGRPILSSGSGISGCRSSSPCPIW